MEPLFLNMSGIVVGIRVLRYFVQEAVPRIGLGFDDPALGALNLRQFGWAYHESWAL